MVSLALEFLMYIHTVFFWLKEGVSEGERAGFSASLAGLSEIASVRDCRVGRPVLSDRAVVDDSFCFSLNLRFDDVAGHDAYQVDVLHDRFVEEGKGLWEKVVIYDADAL